jgi:uncharacterized YigZ family protein
MIEDEFLTIERGETSEIKIKGSRFIGTTQPVVTEQEAIDFIAQISKKFHDASHNCYAFQIGCHSSMIARYNDAGEPAGTAGMPILTVIKGKELTDTAVVVTRYFGGTKLGKGGLVRAYSDCTRLALEKCSIVKKYLYQNLRLAFDYNLTGNVMRVISQFNGTVVRSSYDTLARIEVSVRLSVVDKFKTNLVDVTSGKLSIIQDG